MYIVSHRKITMKKKNHSKSEQKHIHTDGRCCVSSTSHRHRTPRPYMLPYAVSRCSTGLLCSQFILMCNVSVHTANHFSPDAFAFEKGRFKKRKWKKIHQITQADEADRVSELALNTTSNPIIIYSYMQDTCFSRSQSGKLYSGSKYFFYVVSFLCFFCRLFCPVFFLPFSLYSISVYFFHFLLPVSSTLFVSLMFTSKFRTLPFVLQMHSTEFLSVIRQSRTKTSQIVWMHYF